MADFSIETTGVDALVEKIDQYGNAARETINEVFHGEGAEEIKKQIAVLLPSSGRTWNKKAPSAKSVMPGSFSQDNGNLSVTIAARGKYGYLYFPDDGSNTLHHAGNQQFMLHGAENATDNIIETVTNKLVEKFEEA